MGTRTMLVGLLVAWSLSACTDDEPSPADGGDSSTGGATTLPLPTVSDTDAPDTTTDGGETLTTTLDETGTPPDLPPEGPSDCERLDELLAALPGADPGTQQTLVDDFVHTVSYGEHGFPAVEGNDLCVLTVDTSGYALSVAGDFNAWTPEIDPLPEVVDGIYAARITLDAPPQGLYKLVRDDTDFYADPLARRFGWDGFGEYSQVDALPDRGHHERWPGFDQGAGELEPRTVTVYLPVGAPEQAGLPVLYMHDGQNLFSPDAFFGGWQVSSTLEQAIGDGTLGPLVVVGIDNTAARFDEYTQVTDDIGGMIVGGRADEYADFLVNGIKPFVEARYGVSSDPADVGTMGSSLGGLVSLYIGLRHPDVFGQVASMSGTIDWGASEGNPTIDTAYVGDPPLGLHIYLDSGGSEGMGCPNGGSDNYCGNVRMADALRGLGWTDEVDLFYRWDPGALHNESEWAGRFLDAMIDWWPAA